MTCFFFFVVACTKCSFSPFFIEILYVLRYVLSALLFFLVQKQCLIGVFLITDHKNVNQNNLKQCKTIQCYLVNIINLFQ